MNLAVKSRWWQRHARNDGLLDGRRTSGTSHAHLPVLVWQASSCGHTMRQAEKQLRFVNGSRRQQMTHLCIVCVKGNPWVYFLYPYPYPSKPILPYLCYVCQPYLLSKVPTHAVRGLSQASIFWVKLRKMPDLLSPNPLGMHPMTFAQYSLKGLRCSKVLEMVCSW